MNFNDIEALTYVAKICCTFGSEMKKLIVFVDLKIFPTFGRGCISLHLLLVRPSYLLLVLVSILLERQATEREISGSNPSGHREK